LLERALRLAGAHLGSIWIKPKPSDDILHQELLGKSVANVSSPVIAFPSRPIQLAKIVHETSVIWTNSKADPTIANQFASGTEISCPILDAKDGAQFCYVVEVKRSPIAPQKIEESELIPREVFSPSNITRGLKSGKNKPTKAAGSALRHQPVLYSLIVHPPIVIEVRKIVARKNHSLAKLTSVSTLHPDERICCQNAVGSNLCTQLQRMFFGGAFSNRGKRYQCTKLVWMPQSRF
jgi:hypothetical protein